LGVGYGKMLTEKRIINTVTTGRSGTHYLARILGYLTDVDVFHESLEHPYHSCLRKVQGHPDIARTFLLEKTIPFIERCKASVFIETSHLFCKGFFEPFIELGGRPDLIILRREKSKIAKSLLELGTIPGNTGKAMDFYLSPSDPDVWKPDGWESFDDYQRCYWYTLEIERRARVYRREALSYGGRVCEVDLDELTTMEGYKKLIREMDLNGPGVVGWLKFLKNRKKRAGNFDIMKKQASALSERQKKERSLDESFEEFYSATNGIIL